MSETATPTCRMPIPPTLEIEDVLRKAMAASPPALADDSERLAYYRGFLAGAGRQAFEGSRFARYEDLVFRIAAEQDRRSRRAALRLSYEDMVSVGYEAVLEMVRKKSDPDRTLVAACIRRRLTDEARTRFGRVSTSFDKKRRKAYVADTRGRREVYGRTGHQEAGEDGVGAILRIAAPLDLGAEERDLLERIRSRIGEADALDPRLHRIMELRLEGRRLREIGGVLGLSESSVSKILIEARPWLEEHVLPLVEIEA